MSTFPEQADSLAECSARGDRIGAWDAAGRLLPWLSDLRNTLDAEHFRRLVWMGAICNGWFDIAELLASAVASRADAPLGLRRLHAQMLMERGFHEEALARLHRLLERTDLSESDRSETLGHIGRINKDRFVEACRSGDEQGGRKFLRDAIEAYDSSYTAHRLSWHGINVVALLSRPEALAINAEASAKARRIAQDIIQNEAALKGDLYVRATLAEAHIALNDFSSAVDLIRGYVTDPSTSGFQLGNLRRQFTRVWELDRGGSPGPEMVAMISAALLEREGAVLRLSIAELQRAKEVTPASYEAVFGGDRFDSFENYRRGLDRCSCVARIGRSADTGVGTGFVLPGKVLSSKLGDAAVLVTNAHVISEAEEVRQRGALHPSEAVVTFAALETFPRDKEVGIARVLFSSPPEELDVTVAELSDPVLLKESYRIAPVLPARGSDARVRVVGHPSGRGLSLSVNTLLDCEAPKLHYKTATEGGSSGSPVFNQDWNLIGLHHAGGEQMPRLNGQSGTYQANEGIWIRSICDALDKSIS